MYRIYVSIVNVQIVSRGVLIIYRVFFCSVKSLNNIHNNYNLDFCMVTVKTFFSVGTVTAKELSRLKKVSEINSCPYFPT